MESPVRLRAAATFPGVPPHLWILLVRTTLPFAGSELSFPGGPLVHASDRAGEQGLCAVPLRSWFGNLDG